MEMKFITPSTTLRKHVENLLKDGKRSQSEEFQVLFRVFGEERIRKMVSEIKQEKASKDELRAEV